MRGSVGCKKLIVDDISAQGEYKVFPTWCRVYQRVVRYKALNGPRDSLGYIR